MRRAGHPRLLRIVCGRDSMKEEQHQFLRLLAVAARLLKPLGNPAGGWFADRSFFASRCINGSGRLS
jgi:hypothetical protein